MQNLEKILEEIENERIDIDDYSDAKSRMLARHWNSCIDVVEDIIRKHMNDGWIPVEERLPEEEYCTVLCVTDKNYYCVAVYNEKYGFRTGDIDVEGAIIAWRPLPDPYRPESLETRKELEEDSKGERENETFTSRNIEAV